MPYNYVPRAKTPIKLNFKASIEMDRAIRELAARLETTPSEFIRVWVQDGIDYYNNVEGEDNEL